jgi:hypothetical protein
VETDNEAKVWGAVLLSMLALKVAYSPSTRGGTQYVHAPLTARLGEVALHVPKNSIYSRAIAIERDGKSLSALTFVDCPIEEKLRLNAGASATLA